MPQNIPKNYSILVVVLTIVCVILGYYILNSSYPAYTQAKASYVLANQTNTQLNQALSDVQTFLTNYKQLQGDAGRVQQALPAGNADMPNFVASISQLAQVSGVALSNFQISTPTANASTPNTAYAIQAEDLGLTASGTYESFKDFILRVENHLRLIDIYHVSVSSGSSTGSTDILQFQIKIHTYYQQ